jgi:serine/threonine-protein kinase
LFRPVDGEPLESLLRRGPQPWINHVGWITIQLATTLNLLHTLGVFHLALQPAAILVRFTPDTSAPHIVLCDLGVCCDASSLAREWDPTFVPAAYLAPELLTQSVASIQSDVYGIGLVLYEMLVGRSAFPYRAATEEEARDAIQRNRPVRMDRFEDASELARIAVQASSPSIQARQTCAADLVEQLVAVVGEIPVKRRNPWLRLDSLAVVAMVLVSVAVVFALALAIPTS